MKNTMYDVEDIYAAYIKFPQVAGKIEFNYSVMEMEKRYPDMLEMKHYYFTSKNVSTKYFEKNMLEKEYEISDSLKIYYSQSKEKCIEWLQKNRDELIHDYKFNYERLLKSEIKEVKGNGE